MTVEELRRLAGGYPGVEEFVHHLFKVPGWRVAGKGFMGAQPGGETAVFSVGLAEAAAAVASAPEVYEEVWRPGRTRSLVGVRVRLAEVSDERVAELVDHAWRNKAPKRLIARYDGA